MTAVAELMIAGSLDALAADANELYELAETSASNAVEYAWQCGQKLIEAKAQLKHGEWLPWLTRHCPELAKNEGNLAQRYMKLFKSCTVQDLPSTVRQGLKLLAAPDKADHQQITSSESVEWYTPPQYVEAAREVMGGIDLDPATCDVANEKVKAETYYTQADDGLAKEWAGRVWMNPPYGKACAAFIAKLLQDYEAGRVQEAVILVNSNSNDTEWFRPLWDHTLCFSYGRVNFWNEEEQENGPTHGSCFVYLGKNTEAFKAAFGRFGAVVRRA